MAATVQEHATDVAEWADRSLPDFFDLVRGGTYNREPLRWNAQVVARPRDSISKAVPVAACANKAIIVASWAQLHRIPWRLVAVGKNPGFPPHHVYVEMQIAGSWLPVDATYPWSVLFTKRNYPVRVEYNPNQGYAA